MRVLVVYAHHNPESFTEADYDTGWRDAMDTILCDWCLKMAGVKETEHVYFYAAAAADDETRARYLNRAYELGRESDPLVPREGRRGPGVAQALRVRAKLQSDVGSPPGPTRSLRDWPRAKRWKTRMIARAGRETLSAHPAPRRARRRSRDRLANGAPYDVICQPTARSSAEPW